MEDKVNQVWVGLGNVAGKGSKNVARGIQKRLELVTREGTKISGITVNSGAGTPESLLRELELLEIMEPSASESVSMHAGRFLCNG